VSPACGTVFITDGGIVSTLISSLAKTGKIARENMSNSKKYLFIIDSFLTLVGMTG
jgi:hypothetical protein